MDKRSTFLCYCCGQMEGRRLNGEPPNRNGGKLVNPIGNKRPSHGEAGVDNSLGKSFAKRPRKSSNGLKQQ